MSPSVFRQTLAAAAAAVVAFAAHADDNTVRAAFTHIQVNDKNNGLSGIGVPPGAGLDVDNTNTLLLTYERRVLPNIGIELAIGAPPTIDVYGEGSIAFLGRVAKVKEIAPTVFVNYHFGADTDDIRPFVGLGINYTHFYGAESALGQRIELSNSVGIAAQAGVDYRISGPWSMFAAVAMAKVKSDLVATATTVQRTTIDFRPIVVSVGVAYAF